MKKNTLNCLVVDDEPLARKVLIDYISDTPNIELINELKSAVELKKYLDNKSKLPEIIFLDINMPKMTGMEFAKNFPTDAHIVFTTAYPEFAVEAFELQAADYLLKPISFKRFLKCIDKLRDEPELITNNWIVIKEDKRLYKIMHEDILYLQAYGDYVKFITKEKKHITKGRLSEFGEKVGEQFQQCHRSFIVNLSHVQYLEGNHLVVGEEKVPLSSSFKDKFLDQFS